MKSKVKLHVWVLHFYDVGYSGEKISNMLEPKIDEILSRIPHDPALDDWKVVFQGWLTNPEAMLNKDSYVMVSLRSRSDIELKRKEIVVHIPIPLKREVDWGVDPEQHVDVKPLKPKYFIPIKVQYADFKDRPSYLLDCLQKAIKASFEKGFSVNKHKIRLVE